MSGANHVGLEDFYGGIENRSLQASDDGVTFKQVASASGSIVPENTVSFPATTAKYFRLVYKTLESQPNIMAIMAGLKPEPPKPMGVEVSEFVLHTTDRIDRLEDKAGFTPWKEDTKTFLAQKADAISTNEVIDVTSKMNADGTLNWTAPPPPMGELKHGIL